MHSEFTDNRHAVAEVKAAILVVRTLARTGGSEAADGTRMRSPQTLARYGQLLASRSRCSPLETYRLVLAAWLSGLVGRPEIVREMAERHGVAAFLDADAPPSGGSGVAERIFRVVQLYQLLADRDPRVQGDYALTRRCLLQAWGDDPPKEIIHRFIKILRDEAVLIGGPGGGGFEGGRARVLIVDPAECVSPVLSPPLQEKGFEVNVVEDSEAAGMMLETARPDAVLIEKDLPLFDGIELCRLIKADPKTADIPLFLMASRRARAVERRGFAGGCEDIFARPVDTELLALRLRRAIAERPREPAPPPAGVVGTLSDMALPDLIQIVCAGSKSLVITLSDGDRQGEVHIADGQIVHAVAGDREGDAAFYELMRWKDGRFASRPCADFPVRTIQTPMMTLLIEGAKQADEAEA